MAELKVAGSPAPGNGISMEDLEKSCLGYSVVAGEIGDALKTIAEHLDCIGESSVRGDVYLLEMLYERAMKLANDVDNMPFELKGKAASHA